MSKSSLTNGVSLKVENRSGFDKSRFNALTTGVGTITPIVKQFLIPNSDVSCRLKISAQLPPLATDAFLRTHLKLEAFFVPCRQCYGGFESFFCGKEVYDSRNNAFVRAKLPVLTIPDYSGIASALGVTIPSDAEEEILDVVGPGSLCDYLGAYSRVSFSGISVHSAPRSNSVDIQQSWTDGVSGSEEVAGHLFNIFPFVSYALIYDEYYRNKLVERPLFSPPGASAAQGGGLESTDLRLYHLPYIQSKDPINVLLGLQNVTSLVSGGVGDLPVGPDPNFTYWMTDELLNGYLFSLHQRNYGDDYFTAATPSAQEGSPISVTVTNGQFTIQSLRLQNALQEFAEVNNFASPDYIQTLKARYGASLSAGVAQKPILLGSADFPMYTSGVEQTAQGASQQVNTPFDSVGARYGRGHAEGSDFVCKFHVDEPGYFMVMVTLCPEAQYFQGVQHDLLLMNKLDGNLVDIPCSLLEHVGNEPINSVELFSGSNNQVFGYVQRFLAHKLGSPNEVHGLFRKDQSLGSFVVQRDFTGAPSINSSFLKIRTTDLDNVAAVSAGISGYGVMIDSAIDLFVSEPLSESAIPSLVNPAKEHGRSVYVKTGGSKLA